MKRIYRWLGLAATTLALSTPAYGLPFTLVGGTEGAIPRGTTNDFISVLFDGPQIGGYFGADIRIDVLEPSMLVFEFFGAEAGYVNSFEYAGSTLFTHSGAPDIVNISSSLAAPLGTFSTAITANTLLPFGFSVNGGADTVINGSNPDDSAGEVSGPNFFATCNPFTQGAGAGVTNCSSVYLFLDDGGGGPDDDHDDFLVRMSAVSVPEPATILTSLLGLAFLASRRSRSRR